MEKTFLEQLKKIRRSENEINFEIGVEEID
jgi:hypothetical protein